MYRKEEEGKSVSLPWLSFVECCGSCWETLDLRVLLNERS